MQRFASMFSQVLQLFSRNEFESAVRKHRAEHASKGFSCWGHLVAMLFCQLGRAHSLREICGGLASCEGKLRHLGMSSAPKRSTLSYANEHRPWELYQTVFLQLLDRCRTAVPIKGVVKKFKFRNKLVSLDSSTIDLALSLYDWAKFRRAKGAVKLHMVLDHDGYLPSFALITDGKVGDITAARMLRFEPGTVLVMDRGYNDYEWFAQLTEQGVSFITRLKDNAAYKFAGIRPIPESLKDDIVLDWNITFNNQKRKDKTVFRIVTVRSEDRRDCYTYLTNNMDLDAVTLAAVYKDRWQIELFFKAIKQNLKIKTFLGTSANAVKTQIWTALIAILLLRWLQLRSSFGWSLSNLVALLRQQLFVYRDLWTWLDNPFEGPPQLDDGGQLSFNF